MKLKRNITYNFIYQILVILIPLATTPYLSRTIGSGGVGTYSFAYSVALYFTYFTQLGLANYGNREIAQVQESEEERSRKFFEIYTMQAMCFALCCAVYILYVCFIVSDRAAALCMLPLVISSALDINWFFFGMEQFKITVIRNTVIKLAAMASIFIFVRDPDDVYIYILIMAVSFLLSQLCLWPFLKQFIKPVKITLKGVLSHFKPNLVLFIPVISVSIYKLMDKVMLGVIADVNELGFYENAERIITVPISLVTAVGTVMLPRVSALLSQGREGESRKYFDKTMLLILAFANAAMAGIIAVADDFAVLFFGDGFEQSGVIMKYLAVTVLFLAFGNVVRTQYLIPNHKDKIYIGSAIAGALVNFTINLLLIPRLGSSGAAVGTVAAEFVVCVYQCIGVRKELKFAKYFKEELVFLLISALMFTAVKFLPDIGGAVLNLLFEICAGAAVYIALAFIYIKIRYPKLLNLSGKRS